jgi:RimJ/RimL family protein N-acetyltransferase
MSDVRMFGGLVEGWSEPKFPTASVVQGQYVTLEPLQSSRHAKDLFEANRKSNLIWDYLPYGPFESLADYSAWVQTVEEQTDPFFYAVREAESGKALGVMSFLRISPTAGSIEVGHINWSLPLQKTPAATETVYLMMKWAFEAGYRRFEWKCNALNTGSRRAAQRFGFSYEGVFRQHLVSQGRNRDTAWFACIDSEWPALMDAYETWLAPSNFDENGLQKSSLADLTRAIRVADDPSLAG